MKAWVPWPVLRLTAQVVRDGNWAAEKGGRRSVLFSRMNVSSLTSGAIVEGRLKFQSPSCERASTSGAESTQRETSEVFTLNDES